MIRLRIGWGTGGALQGHRHLGKLFNCVDTPNFRVDQVDNTIWEWVKNLLLHPENIVAGLQGMQEEAVR